jgi:hypothetical protein
MNEGVRSAKLGRFGAGEALAARGILVRGESVGPYDAVYGMPDFIWKHLRKHPGLYSE